MGNAISPRGVMPKNRVPIECEDAVPSLTALCLKRFCALYFYAITRSRVRSILLPGERIV
jgi:hypothetical protein